MCGLKRCLRTMALRLQPNSLNPNHEHAWPEPVSPTPHWCPSCHLGSYTAATGCYVSGLTFTLGISVPPPLGLKLESLYLNSCWPCLASCLISIKSLTAVSLNFLLCEMSITISTYYYRIGVCLFLKSITHPFHTFIGSLPA